MPQIRIGTSGWIYRHWRGRFYPETLPQSRWLSHYMTVFDTVEINSSFYHMPKETAFERWREAAPDGFLFAVKGSRYVTHLRKLSGVDDAVRAFVERASLLREHLGPILWQLPAGLHYSRERLEALVGCLPPGRRYVLEVRHPSWLAPEALSLLRDAGIAFCIADTPVVGGDDPNRRLFPYAEEVTADFVYVRLHGHLALYASKYTEEELRSWADKIPAWHRAGLDVFIYFDNDANAYAVINARRLAELVGGRGCAGRSATVERED